MQKLTLFVAVVAVVSTLVSGGATLAATMAFDHIFSPLYCGAGARDLWNPVIEGDFIARAGHQPSNFSVQNPGPCYSVVLPDNGSAHARLSSTSEMRVSRVDGAPFDMLSLDFAEYSEVVLDLFDSFDVIGRRADGSTITETLVFDKILDGAGGEADFQTHVFGSTWSQVVAVEFHDSGAVVDNLRMFTIPEPSSASLILFGLTALGFHCRSRPLTEEPLRRGTTRGCRRPVWASSALIRGRIR